MEKGTSLSSCSRSMAVTVIASSSSGASVKSIESSAPAVTFTSLRDCVRTPGSDAATV